MPKCARKDCTNEGFLSFLGKPDVKFCQGCYEYIARKIKRINAKLRLYREERRNEAEDNQPARIRAEM